MATDGEWEDYFDELFEPEQSVDYADLLFGAGYEVDPIAQEMFGEWMDSGFKDDEALGRLSDYMWEEYEIDFEAVYDWEDFDEWYSSQ